MMAKTLVLYYSFEGNTKKIAEVIAKETGADIEEVKPVKEMRSRGFGKFLWGGSQVIMNKKPELRTLKVNPNDYDLIFIGTPVWASTYAPPIKTVLETGLFRNKKVAFFCTHEGGPGKIEEKAKNVIEKENEFIGSINLLNVAKNLDQIKMEISAWAKEMSDK